MELASAVIPSRDTEVHDTDTNQDVNIETKLKAYNPVYLDEFGKLLLNTSENRPQYQLLTANCRWFARSTLLNVAGRLSQHPLSEQTWNGLDHIPFDVLKKNLLNDPFGGKQLEGPRANLLAFANQLESLAASLIKGQPIAVINGFEEGVDKGETLIGKLEQLVRSASGSNQESDPDRRIYLLAYANYIYGTANRLLSHLNEAAVLLQRSRELLDPLQAASNDHSLLYLDVLTGLGSVAHSQKQYPSARDVRASVVEHWRARYNVSATSTDFDSAMGLARALGFYARSLAVIRSTTPTRDPLHRPEALEALQEAEKLARATYEVRSDLAHELLAWVLSQKAGALSDISEDGPEMQSALDAASEAVELTRPLYKANHAMMRRSFASRLRLKADLARKLLQFEAACEAGTEVLPVIRVEYGIAPRTYAADLQNAMNDLIRDVRKLEEGPQASDVARAAIQEMRAVIASLKELVISSDVQNTELGSGEQHAVHKAVYLVLVELFAHMLVRVAKGPVASAAFIVQGENSLVKEHKVLKSELATYGKVYNGHPKIVRTF
ncbi:hypothetical protein DL93DRAFT_2085376 [Clavulina sp. PMI_390]|nr:hypothetical protein DL93DRAFT_2085376 [Clavulina sp. PMI_390]